MKKTVSTLLFLVMLMCMTPNAAQGAELNSAAGQVSITSGNLNVRTKASSSAAIAKKLANGSYITLISKSGSWWYVEYAKGQYGYCHTSYIDVVSYTARAVNITSGSLNVRSGAAVSYQKKASLAKGEVVIVLSTSGGWSRILYHGTETGYVRADYLSKSAEVSYSSYPAVTLSVPSFKQTDSRWANVKIASSGKTISQIGCATTAVAMMESYRTGKTVYPDAMSKRLSYTSSGNMYWPTHYTTVTSSSGYLNSIYSLLKQGKPVLFGAKTSAGRQHWVVISGYNGATGTLSASGFKINDPGSSSRVNLQQFLNAYPIFYKYFHY